MAEILFGTRGYMRPIPAPTTGAEFVREGWSGEDAVGLNGGARVRNSSASHMVYNMEWAPSHSRDDLRPIMDFASGIYGDGLIYFHDPTSADKNALPEHWAFPAMSGLDGPLLYGRKRPKIVPTEWNTLSYPSRSMRYDLTGPSKSVYIPIPAGHTAWVGAHGTSDGWGGVKVTPFKPGDIADASRYPDILSVNNPMRVNTPFPGALYDGIEVSLGTTDARPLDGSYPGPIYPGDTTFPTLDPAYLTDDAYPALDSFPNLNSFPESKSAPATSITLAGLMVQVLPDHKKPRWGAFISGQGHSGVQFSGKPQQTAYIVHETMERFGMTARLVETGSWL